MLGDESNGAILYARMTPENTLSHQEHPALAGMMRSGMVGDMREDEIIDGPLARAARALVRVSAKDVASKSQLDRTELKRFEKGLEDLTEQQEFRLLEALEGFGARIVRDDDSGGYGVRLKFNRSKVRAIERWEDEGGLAAGDDV